jgi:hypothetical protein
MSVYSSDDDDSYSNDFSDECTTEEDKPVTNINPNYVMDDTTCGICSEEFDNPIKLECGHIYCFLCLKGSILNNMKQCPLCRHNMSKTYLNDVLRNPQKLCATNTNINKPTPSANDNITINNSDVNVGVNVAANNNYNNNNSNNDTDNKNTDNNQYIWIYSSKSHSWWEYDKKAIAELEENYTKWKNATDKSTLYPMMICGLLLDIDFNNMRQVTKKNNSYRNIRRVTSDKYNSMRAKKKIVGTAGITYGYKQNK